MFCSGSARNISSLWPGDTTIEHDRAHYYEGGLASSLYEYMDSGGGEPVLVGVRNSGALHGSPYINDGAQLISECGTNANAISADGEVVYFTATAADQGPESKHCNAQGEGVGPTVNELYARVGAASTVKISGGAPAQFQGVSEDGRQVFFIEGEGLYEYDFDAPEGSRVTLLASQVAEVNAVAGDGSRVYFTSTGELTTRANANGETALAGASNLFMHEAGVSEPRFVARESNALETTQNGGFVLLEATRDLQGTNDTSPVKQLFEYDAATGAIARVSAGHKSPMGYECPATKVVEEGYDCDGNTSTEVPSVAVSPFANGPAAATSGRSLAQNGTVVFASGLALTPQAQPAENIYEYQAGNVYLVSPGDEAPPLSGKPRLYGISGSAKDVIFGTSASLVTQDTDTQYSRYDAREGGGFPAPVTFTGCEGETCQGAVGAPPQLGAPVTNTTVASGNLAPPPPAKPVVKPVVKHESLQEGLHPTKTQMRKEAESQKVNAGR